MELFKKHRPTSFDGLYGQDAVVSVLKKWIEKDKLPHTILMTGSSGCGKTTTARILRKHLGCKTHDFVEQNCADFRGIDSVRDIRRTIGLAPIGKNRMWLLDEFHQLGGPGQQALLKMLEDTPPHVYFVLCTTEPNKVIDTIHTRSSVLKFKSLSSADTVSLLKAVAKEEDKKFSQDVLDKIAFHADGSARKALVILNSILDLDDEKEQLNAILSSETKEDSIKICRALVNPRTTWAEMSAILKACDLKEPEGLRHLVLAYFTSCLLGNNPQPRHSLIIDRFSSNLFDGKKAEFINWCYEIIGSKR